MRTKLVWILLVLLGGLATACATSHQAQTTTGETVHGAKAASINRVRTAASNLQRLMSAPDSAIPRGVIDNAKCVAIVPDMVKGGFVFGAEHGRGVATCRLPSGGWSQPAFFVVTGGTWGLQIGLESVDLVMLVMNQHGMQQLLSSQFKLGATGSVAAGPVGRAAQASTNWKMQSEVLVYSRTRGLFAGLDLSGAVIKADGDATVAFYGQPVPFQQILMGQGPRSNESTPLLAAVQNAQRKASEAAGREPAPPPPQQR